jgi:hypothetical protein
MRASHHYPLEDGLAAYQGFLAAFERGQELHSDEETPECSQEPHGDWMILWDAKNYCLDYHMRRALENLIS